MLADKVRYLRFINSTKALTKAKKVLDSNGIEASVNIELRNLFPLIENCSLEEDELLIEKWAGLIASAASDSSFSSYIHILSSLNSLEALMLDTINSKSEIAMKSFYQYYGSYVETIRNELRIDADVLVSSLGNLSRLGLILTVQKGEPALIWGNPLVGTIKDEMVGLTPLGARFLSSCYGNNGKIKVFGPYMKTMKIDSIFKEVGNHHIPCLFPQRVRYSNYRKSMPVHTHLIDKALRLVSDGNSRSLTEIGRKPRRSIRG